MRQEERQAFAHLVRFSADGRELVKAVEAFNAARLMGGMFPDLLRLTKRSGNLAAYMKMWELCPRDLVSSDFDNWFVKHGVFWFAICRDRVAGVAFVEQAEWDMFRAAMRGVETDSPGEMSEVLRKAFALPLSDVRRQLLAKLITGEEPVVAIAKESNPDTDFRVWCAANGVSILRVLQEGIDGIERQSWTYLAIDNDGLAKVFKAMPSAIDDRFGPHVPEDVIFRRLGPIEFGPRCYGTVDCGGTTFIKMSFCYGQSLADYTRPEGVMLGIDEAAQVIARLATHLSKLHAAGVVYGDLRPENVVLAPDETFLLDYGDTLLLPEGAKEADAIPRDPRFVPPETALSMKASPASDVFQLGLLAHMLLAGRGAFAPPGGQLSRIDALEHYGLAHAFEAYLPRVTTGLGRDASILGRMLEKDPQLRPSAAEVAEAFKPDRPRTIRQRGRQQPQAQASILFPARMGIPHKGHIEYLVRILELGFKPIISLEKSYVSTDDDPLPKWLVMKMVAQSLFDRGFGPERFHFVFTPFPETQLDLKLHFAMMPGMSEVVAVASSNPDVHALFDPMPILDQRVVFGLEGERYHDRSWGAILRKAVREGDRQTFLDYAASGVERIMGFHEIRRRYNGTPIEFVQGKVRISVIDEYGNVMADARIRRYLSPEECAMRALQERGIGASIIDPYQRDATVTVNGKSAKLCWLSNVIVGDDVVIRFKLIL